MEGGGDVIHPNLTPKLPDGTLQQQALLDSIQSTFSAELYAFHFFACQISTSGF
jgi:hypothetical protein